MVKHWETIRTFNTAPRFAEAPKPMLYSMANFAVRHYVSLKLDAYYYDLENIPKGRGVVVANHSDAWDPPVIGLAIAETDRPAHNLAKKELWDYPLLGRFLTGLGQIKTERDPKIRDSNSFRQGKKVLEEDKLLIIFPAGTRQEAEFKKGVAHFATGTRSPVIPTGVVIEPKDSPLTKRKRIASVVFGEPFEATLGLNKSEARQEIMELSIQRVAEMHQKAKMLTQAVILELDGQA